MSRWTASLAVLLVACTTPVGPAPQAGDEPQPGAQTALERKRERTPAEQKIDSRLLDAIERDKAGEPANTGRRSDLDIDAEGRVLVDIRAEVTDELTRAIEDASGIVESKFPQYNSLRARVPIRELLALAALSDVRFISPAEQPITNAPR